MTIKPEKPEEHSIEADSESSTDSIEVEETDAAEQPNASSSQQHLRDPPSGSDSGHHPSKGPVNESEDNQKKKSSSCREQALSQVRLVF